MRRSWNATRTSSSVRRSSTISLAPRPGNLTGGRLDRAGTRGYGIRSPRTDLLVPHPIVDDEQKLLASVRTLLEEEPYVAPPSESDIVSELVRLRDDMPTAKEE